MVNLASFGYQSPVMEQETRSFEALGSSRSQEAERFEVVGSSQSRAFGADDRFANISGLDNAVSSLRQSFGMGSSLSDTEENSATSEASAFNATTTISSRGSFGIDNFNARQYGLDQDAKAAAAAGGGGGSSEGGYEPDENRSVAVEKAAPSKEVANLEAYQGLISKGFTHDEIYQAQSKFGVSNEDMLHNVNTSEKGELVPQDKEAELVAQLQAKEFARDFQKSMEVPESQQAKNGVSATIAGAETSVGVARMMV